MQMQSIIATAGTPRATRGLSFKLRTAFALLAVLLLGLGTLALNGMGAMNEVSTQTVTSSIAGVSQATNNTAVAAAQVLGAASGLSRQTASLSAKIDGFIAKIRAV